MRLRKTKSTNVSPFERRTSTVPSDSSVRHKVDLLTALAKRLLSEIDQLEAELSGRKRQIASHTTPLHPEIHITSDGIDFYKEVERYEIDLIKAALTRGGGSQTEAARLLGMHATTLNAKIKHYGIYSLSWTMVDSPVRRGTKHH